MKKWDGLIYCVKCGARDAEIRYREESLKTLKGMIWLQYLDFTCVVCKHKWTEFPLDHRDGENE